MIVAMHTIRMMLTLGAHTRFTVPVRIAPEGAWFIPASHFVDQGMP